MFLQGYLPWRSHCFATRLSRHHCPLPTQTLWVSVLPFSFFLLRSFLYFVSKNTGQKSFQRNLGKHFVRHGISMLVDDVIDMKDSQSGPSIEVNHEKAIEELVEILV